MYLGVWIKLADGMGLAAKLFMGMASMAGSAGNGSVGRAGGGLTWHLLALEGCHSASIVLLFDAT